MPRTPLLRQLIKAFRTVREAEARGRPPQEWAEEKAALNKVTRRKFLGLSAATAGLAAGLETVEFRKGVRKLDPPTRIATSIGFNAPQIFTSHLARVESSLIVAVGIFYDGELHWVPRSQFQDLRHGMQAVLAHWRKLLAASSRGANKADLELAWFEDEGISGRILYLQPAGLEDSEETSGLHVRILSGDKQKLEQKMQSVMKALKQRKSL